MSVLDGDMEPFVRNQVLGVMLSCATGLITVCGAMVVYSTRLSFLWEPRSLVVALGVATGGMLFFTFVDLVPEGLLAFENVIKLKMNLKDEDDEINQKGTVQGFASLMLAGAFAAGSLIVWIMDTLCLHYAAPTKRRRFSRDRAATMRTTTDSFPPRSPTRAIATRTTANRRGQTLVLASNVSDVTVNELLYKTGTARVIAFAVQNIPQGFVLCLATLHRQSFGVLFACAIALLNLTQGMALSGVLAQSSGLRWRAVLWCVLAALGLPLGGFVAWAWTIDTMFSTLTRAIVYAITSGILVGLSLTQLLTVCCNHKSTSESNCVPTSVLSGVVFLASLRMLLAFLNV